ncbi:hypothetical protein [Leisingera sp. JC11]|uniref:hypothetical protein n=1 Tax=Leisingera sp. JC11 TaxID=3042469 RepID=UPI0034566AE1
MLTLKRMPILVTTTTVEPPPIDSSDNLFKAPTGLDQLKKLLQIARTISFYGKQNCLFELNKSDGFY